MTTLTRTHLQVHESAVVSPDAYLLFYTRRTLSPHNLASLSGGTPPALPR